MAKLSHLDALEAEAIYIIREVAAECEKPVMLYSIGKDRYFAKEGESFQHRSLPRNTDLSQYHRFVVKKPVHVELAIIAPWFGEPGGGVQYKIPDEVYNAFDEYFQEIPAA